METVEEKKTEINENVDASKLTDIIIKNGVVLSTRGKSIKILSDRTNTIYYQSMTPDYYRNKYHEKKQIATCEYCGCSVTHLKLRRHKDSAKCKKIQNALQK